MRTTRHTLLAAAVVAAVTFTTGCASREGTITPNLSETNKALVKRTWEEVVNQGNLDAAKEFFSENYVYHSSIGSVFNGIEEGVIVTVSSLRKAFPDLHCTVEDLIAEGDKVAYRWSATGTHTAEYVGVAPTKQLVHMTGIYISRIENGKVAEDWSCGDDLGILQQLGAFLTADRVTYTWGESSERGSGTPCSPEQSRALYEREFEEVWTLGDLNALDEIIHPEFVNHDPPWSAVADFESFKAWGDKWINSAPNMHVTIEDIVVEGNILVGRWVARWTDEKGMLGFGPTGKELSVNGIDMIRCVDGKVVERWWAKNNLGVINQLEVVTDLPDF